MGSGRFQWNRCDHAGLVLLDAPPPSLLEQAASLPDATEHSTKVISSENADPTETDWNGVAIPFLKKEKHRRVSLYCLAIQYGLDVEWESVFSNGNYTEVTECEGKVLSAMNAHMCGFAYGLIRKWPRDVLVTIQKAQKLIHENQQENAGILFLTFELLTRSAL